MAHSASGRRTEPLAALEPIRAGLAKPWRRLPGRNIVKADVLFYRLDDIEVAVKDYGPRGWLIRNTVGRLFVRREARAYEAAAGLPGLPPFLGRLGPFAIALEYVHAPPLADVAEPPRDEFFDRLESVVSGLHTRGIAIGDLHHRDVLVADDGVYIVDLATALVSNPGSWGLRRALFRRLRVLDRVAVARMRARWTGRDVTAAAAAVSSSAARWLARGRRLKTFWNRLRRRSRSRQRPHGLSSRPGRGGK